MMNEKQLLPKLLAQSPLLSRLTQRTLEDVPKGIREIQTPDGDCRLIHLAGESQFSDGLEFEDVTAFGVYRNQVIHELAQKLEEELLLLDTRPRTHIKTFNGTYFRDSAIFCSSAQHMNIEHHWPEYNLQYIAGYQMNPVQAATGAVAFLDRWPIFIIEGFDDMMVVNLKSAQIINAEVLAQSKPSNYRDGYMLLETIFRGYGGIQHVSRLDIP